MTLGIDAVFALTTGSNKIVGDLETTPKLIEATTANAIASLLKGKNDD
jgi:hypothetical protein